MKPLLLVNCSFVLGLACFLVACDQKEVTAGQTPGGQTTAILAREADFTPWMSRASLQITSDQNLDGHYFSTVEGRLNNGENQYRAIITILELKKISNAWAQWGLSADELYDWELSLLKLGAERAESQVFTDSTGQAIHQLVMVLPKDVTDSVTEISEPVPESVPEEVEVPSVDPNADVVDFDTNLSNTGEVGAEPMLDPENVESSGDSVSDTGESTSPNALLDIPVGTDQPPVDETGDLELEEAIGMIETPGLPETEVPGVAILVDDPEAEPETETSEPEPEVADPEVADPEVEEPAPTPATPMLTYKVVKGDNLSRISRRFKVSVKAIKEGNGLKSDMLKIGQVLKIPSQP